MRDITQQEFLEKLGGQMLETSIVLFKSSLGEIAVATIFQTLRGEMVCETKLVVERKNEEFMIFSAVNEENLQQAMDFLRMPNGNVYKLFG